MPVLAGWLTGEQVSQETIEQTLTAMSDVLGHHGGQPARATHAGAGLIAYSDSGYAMLHNDEQPVLDWVPERRTLVYRRPLSGMHALYYIEDWPAAGNLLFASEIKALLAVGVPRRLHLAALDSLLRYGFIPAPWTAFQDIYVVPAGSILRWQRAKTVVNSSTDYRFDEPPANASDRLHTLLNTATANILPPHEQLVALTGGDDASALSTLLAVQHTTAPFTIATLGYTPRTTSNAWKNARRVATTCERPFLEIMGIDQPEFWIATLTGLEAPSIDTKPLAFHQLLHTAAAETGARVAISALGASILAGSPAGTKKTHGEPRTAGIYNQMLSNQPGTMTSHLWSQDVAQAIQKEAAWEDSMHARKLARRATQFADKTQASYYLDLHLRMPDLLVNPVQQLATQEHMVVRSPYLHSDVMDILIRLPEIANNGHAKNTLLTNLANQYMRDSARPAATLPLIAPMASLRNIASSELLQQVLAPEAIRATGIFNPQVVAELLRQSGSDTRELLLVFSTQLLCQLFGITL